METRPTDIAQEPVYPERWEKSALGFFAVVLVFYALFGSVAQAGDPTLGLAWTELFVFLLPALAAAAGSNLSPRAFLLLRRRPSPRQLAVSVGMGGALFLAASGVMTLTTLAVPHSWVETFDLTHLFLGSGRQPAMMALLATLLAPLAEEVAFRGYAQSALRTWARPWLAVAASAFLFATMHLDPVRFPAVLLLGVAFGWMAFRSGSLWPSVAAHAVNNGLGSALALLGGAEPSADGDALGALGILAVGLAALAPLAVLYWRLTPAPPPAEDALVLLDPGDRSVRFRLGKVPKRLLWLAVAGLVLLLGMVALRGAPPGDGAPERHLGAGELRRPRPACLPPPVSRPPRDHS